MGRPPLPVGTFGKIGFIEQPDGVVQARARFRDFGGRTRLVSKIGGSRAAAERPLKRELATRRAPGGGGAITAGTRVDALADAWLLADHGWSTGTERVYRSMVKNQVKPALGQLCVHEVALVAAAGQWRELDHPPVPSRHKPARHPGAWVR